jgi:hypothetical protein
VPTAIVYHKVRSSIGTMSPMAVYYSVRNSIFVQIKNVSLSLFFKCFPAVILGTISEFLYIAVRHRHPILYCKAKIDAIKMLPVMLKKRKMNLQAAKVNTESLRKLMTPVFEGNFFVKRFKKLFFG